MSYIIDINKTVANDLMFC